MRRAAVRAGRRIVDVLQVCPVPSGYPGLQGVHARNRDEADDNDLGRTAPSLGATVSCAGRMRPSRAPCWYACRRSRPAGRRPRAGVRRISVSAPSPEAAGFPATASARAAAPSPDRSSGPSAARRRRAMAMPAEPSGASARHLRHQSGHLAPVSATGERCNDPCARVAPSRGPGRCRMPHRKVTAGDFGGVAPFPGGGSGHFRSFELRTNLMGVGSLARPWLVQPENSAK